MVMVIERKVTIKPILNPSLYELKQEQFAKKTGSSFHSVARRHSITASVNRNGSQTIPFSYKETAKFMHLLVPSNPNSPDWSKSLKDFWNSVVIGYTGSLELNISFDISSTEGTNVEINGKTVKSTKDNFIKHCTKNIGNEYLFGMPVNIDDYWKWRYCLISSQVANDATIATTKKGKNMAHFLYNDETNSEIKAAKNKLLAKSMEKYLYTIADDRLVEAVLRTFERNRPHKGIVSPIGSFIFEKLDKAEREAKVRKLFEARPQICIDIVDDKLVTEKTFINQLVSANIVRNAVGTPIYYYGDTVLGESLQDTMAHIKSNPALKTELTVAYKNYLTIKA